MDTLLIIIAVVIGSAFLRYLVQQGRVDAARGDLRTIDKDPNPEVLDIFVRSQHVNAQYSFVDRRHRPWSVDLDKENEALAGFPLGESLGQARPIHPPSRMSNLVRSIKAAAYVLNQKDYPPSAGEFLAEAVAYHQRIAAAEDVGSVRDALQAMILHMIAYGYLVPARRL